ncbi:hypothetical protein [Pseudomonas luteola]|uniref:hypothetical protein n=1 Tax=Pseudomonas luteola TaxID=47886 RepID=UPI003CC7776D
MPAIQSLIYKLTVDGTDISNLIAPRLISLDLTDNRGLEADQLSIVLSDQDGLLAIPQRGAKVRLWLGWNTTGLVDKGTYIVDETEHSGAPDVLSIRARSADLRKTLKAKRDAGYTNTTLGTICAPSPPGKASRRSLPRSWTRFRCYSWTRPANPTPTYSPAWARIMMRWPPSRPVG